MTRAGTLLLWVSTTGAATTNPTRADKTPEKAADRRVMRVPFVEKSLPPDHGDMRVARIIRSDRGGSFRRDPPEIVQFSVGCCTLSTTMTSTGALKGSSLSPSCSRRSLTTASQPHAGSLVPD